MKMINYDFYDIYAVILCVRAKPDNKSLIPVLNEIVSIIDTDQNGNGIESNIVRKSIRNCQGEKIENLSFAKIDNIYTAGVRIIKNNVYYHILSKIFKELILSLETDIERTRIGADCFHNIPVILVDDTKPKKRISVEIKEYRKKYNSEFLAEELKLL